MRVLKSILVVLIVFGSFSWQELGYSAKAAAVESTIKVMIEGAEVPMSVKPIQVNGSIMLHAKSIFQALSISARFDKNKITLKHKGVTVNLEVGQALVHIGDRELRLAQPPLLIDGRIYVPTRLIVSLLNTEVNFDSKGHQLFIGLTEATKKGLLRSLIEAARKGDALAVTSLIQRGADPNGKLIDEYGDNTPLDYAVINNRTDAARALLAGGAKLVGNGQELGFRAIVSQDVELLDALLAAGFDPNYKDHTGTLLEVASGIIGVSEGEGTRSKELYPSLDIVRTLLKYGADPSSDHSLYQAVGVQNFSLIQALLRAGADPYKLESTGRSTPYDLSVSKNINRWMTIQPERAVIPSFSVTDVNGRTIGEGDVNLTSLENLQAPNYHTHWTAGQTYVDEMDGRYRVLYIIAEGKAYMFNSNTSLTIKGETITPSVIKLPELNIMGTLTSDTISTNEGYMSVYNPGTTAYALVEVHEGKFSFYGAPGQYRVVSFHDSVANRSYNMDKNFTVVEGSEVQRINIKH